MYRQLPARCPPGTQAPPPPSDISIGHLAPPPVLHAQAGPASAVSWRKRSRKQPRCPFVSYKQPAAPPSEGGRSAAGRCGRRRRPPLTPALRATRPPCLPASPAGAQGPGAEGKAAAGVGGRGGGHVQARAGGGLRAGSRLVRRPGQDWLQVLASS